MSKNKKQNKFQGHEWVQFSLVGKQVCKGCGLVFSNNLATQWCIKKGCDYKEDPNYKSAMKRLTKPSWAI